MRTQHYIGGQWRDSADGQRLPVVNPSDESLLAEVALGGAAEVDLAVDAAVAAQPAWARADRSERARLLRRIADAVLADEAELVRLQSLNNGKPVAEARIDVADVASCFEYYATLAETSTEANVPLPTADYVARVRREPYGVVGLIVPWNFPMVTTAWKLAPALAAGNAVVLKPSEVTPLPELALAQIIHDAGVPAGVFNTVVGTGPAVGAPLVAHPRVRKISFTGSNAVGTRIMQSAAETIKGVSLELGGKSAIVVFDDADLDVACELVIGGAFMNAGQMCSATSRLLVHAPIADALTQRIVARALDMRLGDPLAERTEMGPLASRAQLDRVLGYVATANEEGLRCLCGGERVGARGYFMQPTVYADVPAASRLWREEIFGPVLAIQTFADEADAIARANDSEFGLVATVVTRDNQRANRVADALEAGLVWVDMPQLIFPQTAWGGMKRSSIGRELGPWGLAAFQQVKHVVAPARVAV
ncbi:MAG TPA: aldehyde dehydrogenase family protein [Burkholderiaceae bacterium]|nr:aldehyde dehydrogenase family protein [Burkholderiaceae bacterium]